MTSIRLLMINAVKCITCWTTLSTADIVSNLKTEAIETHGNQGVLPNKSL